MKFVIPESTAITSKPGEGFSLIELLIVVAIILIIAAIAIPNLLRSRMAANEASAVGSIRSVNTGAFSYNSIYSNGYPSTLTQVGTSAATQATCNASMFIDIVLTSGSKSGYSFTMGPGSVAATAPSGCAAAGYVDGFFIKAVPISAGTSGIRGFCSDQTGIIRFNLGGTATASSSAGSVGCSTTAMTLCNKDRQSISSGGAFSARHINMTGMGEAICTRCCIAGGGPAGMMLGFLLARMGVDIVVLEKHADFLRDFRGDTIHPSTLEVMHELGILDDFLQRPHQELRELSGQIGSETVTIADFTHLPTHCRFLALMPQWDFLNFIKQQASRYPTFHLRMQTEVTELLEEKGAVVGVRAKTPDGELEIRAPLTIGADGRHSVVRECAKLKVIDLGAPMDVMWMRLSRRPSDPGQTFGHIDRGKILVLLNRESYWQCAFVIPKGKADEIRQRGLASFCEEIADLEPFLRDRVGELNDWKDVSLLTVVVDRLSRWSRPGLLCIGDAAHAMSPIGGVGINLAIQDAVATANILGPILLQRIPSESDLDAVQRRRNFPTRATQRLQVVVQNNVIQRVLGSSKPLTLAWPLKLLRRWPILRRIPARLVGVGFRPEHVKTPDVHILA